LAAIKHTALISSLKQMGFIVSTRPMELNIVGVRNNSTRPNSFDDQMHIFFKDDSGKWQHKVWPCTTDPGTYWLRSPMNPQGTAMLKGNMQYKGVYSIGLHKGQYTALVQKNGPVTVIRDYNRDDVLDFGNGSETTGMFGINIHRASSNGTTQSVDRYSAGCQVFANANDFAEFMELCKVHRDRYGNQFTYTLLDQRAASRSKRRKATYVIGAVAIAAGIAAVLINNPES
jgi:hypothetical protein